MRFGAIIWVGLLLSLAKPIVAQNRIYLPTDYLLGYYGQYHLTNQNTFSGLVSVGVSHNGRYNQLANGTFERINIGLNFRTRLSDNILLGLNYYQQFYHQLQMARFGVGLLHYGKITDKFKFEKSVSLSFNEDNVGIHQTYYSLSISGIIYWPLFKLDSWTISPAGKFYLSKDFGHYPDWLGQLSFIQNSSVGLGCVAQFNNQFVGYLFANRNINYYSQQISNYQTDLLYIIQPQIEVGLQYHILSDAKQQANEVVRWWY